jgi:geranylgeranyl diphosphate synthase type I
MAEVPPPEVLSVARRTEERLQDIFDAEVARWNSDDVRLGEAVNLLAEMVMSKGKRLRAAFCYWSWNGTSRFLGDQTDDEERIIEACAAFELLHAFALIHDDIMDDAPTRRGIPTIHTTQSARLQNEGWRGEPRRYGEGIAILLGDLAHAYADRCIGNTTTQARALWDELRIELNLGQYLDLRASAAGEADRATARSVATFKSALYTIVRPLQLGAALAPSWPGLTATTRQEALDGLEAFGRPLGQAFQLRDDLLGVVGEADSTGKPVGGDLREGKPTELLAVALERATPAQHDVLTRIGAPLSEDAVAEIVGVLRATGAVEEIEQRITMLVTLALDLLPSLCFDPSTRVTMAALADYVGLRTH